jgi:deoxyadenosine kinase
MDNSGNALPKMFIGISGIIGVGKTTLATELSKLMNIPVYYEPVIDNAYLTDFYKDMDKYSFRLQVYLLNNRFRQHQQILWQDKGGIQDRTIYEDQIFARVLCNDGHMDNRDYSTYIDLFNNMSNFMKQPNLIVHLDVTPEESLKRIEMRNRECEKGITIDYLTKLHSEYEKFLQAISKSIPVIRVNYEKFHSPIEMANMVYREYNNHINIREVTI